MDGRPINDTQCADAARRRVRAEGLPRLRPDRLIAPYLQDGETVVSRHRVACIRFDNADADKPGPTRRGTLYVTSSRMLLRLVGQRGTPWAVPLDAIVEMTVASEVALLVNVGGGLGVAILTRWPHLVRTEIAAATWIARLD
jgi:hypothetical protein